MEPSDPVSDISLIRLNIEEKMEMVKKAAQLADPAISDYIFKAVTKGISYPALEADGIPCGRDYFYDRFRRFFYILDKFRK